MAVIPMLAYEDGAAAIDWLTKAFGFDEQTALHGRRRDGDACRARDRIRDDHARDPSPDYVSPKRLRELSPEARKMAEVPYVIDGVLVEVEDVDAHFARARDAGATILSEPADQVVGIRHYRVEDPEGHRWMFSQDISP